MIPVARLAFAQKIEQYYCSTVDAALSTNNSSPQYLDQTLPSLWLRHERLMLVQSCLKAA